MLRIEKAKKLQIWKIVLLSPVDHYAIFITLLVCFLIFHNISICMLITSVIKQLVCRPRQGIDERLSKWFTWLLFTDRVPPREGIKIWKKYVAFFVGMKFERFLLTPTVLLYVIIRTRSSCYGDFYVKFLHMFIFTFFPFVVVSYVVKA